MERFAFGITLVVFISVRPVSAHSLSYPLPANEKEAAFMLREGTLDSATWNMVRPYYDQPITAPLGELKYITELFPTMGSFPVSAEELAAYEPWSKREVDRFFNDYPELINLKPILSFQTTRQPAHARIGCALTRYNDSLPMVSSQFSCFMGSTIIARGEARFLGNSAQWRRRSASARMGAAGTLTVGNFALNTDRGLLYGYFPASTPDTGPAPDWRRAGANTWDGVLYEFNAGSHARGEVFYHSRASETAYGARSVIGLGKNLRFIAGASRAALSASGASGAASYAHAGLTVNAHSWEAGISTGLDRADYSAIPVSAYIKHACADAGIDASYSRIPASYKGQFSAIRDACSKKIDNNDSLRGDASVVSLQCRLPLRSNVRSSCGLSYYYTTGKAASEGFAMISGEGWMDYEARYSYRMSTLRLLDNHGITAFVVRRFSRRFSGRMHCRSTASGGSFQSVSARLTAEISPSPQSEISPFIASYTGIGKREISLGVTRKQHFFERTWSEVTMEIPVFTTFQDHWMINAKAYFCF
jgi:hypothetical protein